MITWQILHRIRSMLSSSSISLRNLYEIPSISKSSCLVDSETGILLAIENDKTSGFLTRASMLGAPTICFHISTDHEHYC